MICCDECSVWQHVECVEVDPKNLPDKYLCEECEPRQVDRKRAKLIQIKKREEMTGTDGDDDGSVSADDGRSSGTGSPTPSGRKKKRQKPAGTLRVQELKAEARKNKREKEDVKKGKKKVNHPLNLQIKILIPHSVKAFSTPIS
jgi:histone-lysine N-methyltransferase MLL5